MSLSLEETGRRVDSTTRRFFSPYVAALGALVALGVVLALPGLREPVSFDGEQTYLRLAHRLLNEGFGFFSSPDSIVVAPLAYLWPALFSANEISVRWANIAAYAFAIGLVAYALRVAHSRAAAMVGAALLAASPTLHPFVANVLTEPLFIMLVGTWAAATAKASVSADGARGAIILGAIALAMASLVRPATFLFAPAMLGLAILWGWASPSRRGFAARLAAMFALAAIPVVLWMIRNQVSFGLPGIATGSGAALWLGVDPSVNGFDPVYFGMDYDTGGVARDISHLSIEGDRLLRGAARMELAGMPLGVLGELLVRKAGACLAMSPVELGHDLSMQRAWRVALLMCAFAGLAWGRRSLFAWIVVAWVAYMTAIHLPAMYHRRYSVGAIDVPLTLLAAMGIAEAARLPWRRGVLSMAVMLAAGFVVIQTADRAPGSPLIDRVPSVLLWRADGKVQLELGAAATVDLPFLIDAKNANDYTTTRFRMAIAPTAPHGSCNWMTIQYRYTGEASFDDNRKVRVPVQSDGRLRDVTVGTTQPLHVDRPGVMRLTFECNTSASLRVESIEVRAPRRAATFRRIWLDRIGGGNE